VRRRERRHVVGFEGRVLIPSTAMYLRRSLAEPDRTTTELRRDLGSVPPSSSTAAGDLGDAPRDVPNGLM